MKRQQIVPLASVISKVECVVGGYSHESVVPAVKPLQRKLAAALGSQHEEVVRERGRVLPERQLVCEVDLVPRGQHVVAVCDGDHLVVAAKICSVSVAASRAWNVGLGDVL